MLFLKNTMIGAAIGATLVAAGPPGATTTATTYTVADLPADKPYSDLTKACYDGSYAGKFWDRTGGLSNPLGVTGNGEKWAICHGTAADTNPYTHIEIDVHGAVEHILGQGQGHGGAQKRDDIFPMSVGWDTCMYDCNCDKIVAQPPTLALAKISGDEDTDIAFGLTASLNGYPGSEKLDVWVSGVPADASLSAGTRLDDGRYHFTAADLAGGVTVRAKQHSDVDFDVTATARATLICDPTDYKASGAVFADGLWNDADDGHTGVPATGTVEIIAVADVPSIQSDTTSVELQEDATCAGAWDTCATVTVTGSTPDDDGSETVTITYTLDATKGSVVSKGNGKYEISPAANSDLDFAVTFTATSTEAANGDAESRSQAVMIVVRAVADPVLDFAVAADQNVEVGTAVDLPAFNVRTADTDGSETIAVTCSASGGAISGGCDGSFSADAPGTYDLTFTATSTEVGAESANDCNGARCSDSVSLTTRVTVFAPPTCSGSCADQFPAIGNAPSSFSASVATPPATDADAFQFAPIALDGITFTCPSTCSLSVQCVACSLSSSDPATATLKVDDDYDADQLVTLILTEDSTKLTDSAKILVKAQQQCLMGSKTELAVNDNGQLVLNIQNQGHKFFICHGTASSTNPYNVIDVAWQSLGNGHFKNAECDSSNGKTWSTCLASFAQPEKFTIGSGHGKNNHPEAFIGTYATAVKAITEGGAAIAVGDTYRTTCNCKAAPSAVPAFTGSSSGSLSAGSSLMFSVKCDYAAGCTMLVSGSVVVSTGTTTTTTTTTSGNGNGKGKGRRLLAAGQDVWVPQGETLVSMKVDQNAGYTPKTDYNIQMQEGAAIKSSAGATAPVTTEPNVTLYVIIAAAVAFALGAGGGAFYMHRRRQLKKARARALAAKNQAANGETAPLDPNAGKQKALKNYQSSAALEKVTVDMDMEEGSRNSKKAFATPEGNAKSLSDKKSDGRLETVIYGGFRVAKPAQ